MIYYYELLLWVIIMQCFYYVYKAAYCTPPNEVHPSGVFISDLTPRGRYCPAWTGSCWLVKLSWALAHVQLPGGGESAPLTEGRFTWSGSQVNTFTLASGSVPEKGIKANPAKDSLSDRTIPPLMGAVVERLVAAVQTVVIVVNK